MSSPTILIVEDHPAQQYVFKQLCERFGYDAHLVSTGEDALAALALAQYAAVILDVRLPGIDGLETCQTLRQRERGTDRQTPVIALTGHVLPQDRQDCFDAGMDDYMSKPFSIEAFRKLLLRWTYDASRPNLRLLNSTPDSNEQLFG